ncbi:hypothetical protein FOZ63_012027, partial [Perkinsus olseni]
DGEINDEFVSLLDAGGRIWQMRREPTYGVETIDSFGDLVDSFCDEEPTSRCTAGRFGGRRRRFLGSVSVASVGPSEKMSTGGLVLQPHMDMLAHRISSMLPPPVDGLILEHILSWLMSDVTSAVRMASVCSGWRRAVMDYLRYEGTRTGYGVLDFEFPPEEVDDSLERIMWT